MAAALAFARLLAPAALLAAGAALAAPLGYYAATPAAQPVKADLMTHSTPWRLQNGAYVADRAPERAEILCQLVAARVGRLSAFSADGQPFDDGKLAACNAKAKSAPADASSVAAR